MSRLSIFPEGAKQTDSDAAVPLLVSDDPAVIQAELARRGIGFERWPATQRLADGADQSDILLAYQADVRRIQTEGGYATVDAIRMTPEHPDRASLRQTFLSEHTHAEDEVRFFVEGRGLFSLHIGDEVLVTLCEQGDLIRVPAGTRHWFDMGNSPAFCALRFFNNSEGWVAQFSGDPIAERFPTLQACSSAQCR